MLRHAAYIRYPSRSTAEVAYLVLGDMCVYTGVTSATAPDTEEIIEAICKREEVGPQDLQFYDLQTPHTYSWGEGMSLGKPNQFRFVRVLPAREQGGRKYEFLPIKLGIREIFKEFRRFLGDNPKQVGLREFDQYEI